MTVILSIAEAVTELNSAYYRGKLPEDVEDLIKDKVQFGLSPVDLIARSAEGIYLYREECSEEMKSLAVSLIHILELDNLYGIRENNRSTYLKMVLTDTPLPEGVEIPGPNYTVLPRPPEEVRLYPPVEPVPNEPVAEDPEENV